MLRVMKAAAIKAFLAIVLAWTFIVWVVSDVIVVGSIERERALGTWAHVPWSLLAWIAGVVVTAALVVRYREAIRPG
jgi:hypothetical protein